jgi:hypothetical protein
VLNAFWLTRLLGTGDRAAPREAFDTHVACGAPGRACLDVALEITRVHRTQARDMGQVRALRPQFGAVYLRRFDAEDVAPPRAEPAMP